MTPSGVLLDIDGVLVTSWKAIPGAVAAVHALAAQQIPCSYLTNTTSKTRAEIVELLDTAGISVAADQVLTAAALTADYVREHFPGGRCFLVSSGPIAQDMAGIDLVSSGPTGGESRPDRPDVVVLGGAGPEFDHLTLSWVYQWMTEGVPVIAMHRSMTWQTADGLRIDTGMYLTGMEQASGRTATAIGKPAPVGFEASATRLGVAPQAMVMVGDDLFSDVIAAQNLGMTGVLVRTGKFRQDTLDRWAATESAQQPDFVIDSVADLPDLIADL